MFEGVAFWQSTHPIGSSVESSSDLASKTDVMKSTRPSTCSTSCAPASISRTPHLNSNSVAFAYATSIKCAFITGHCAARPRSIAGADGHSQVNPRSAKEIT